jgi:TPR repeat protein
MNANRNPQWPENPRPAASGTFAGFSQKGMLAALRLLVVCCQAPMFMHAAPAGAGAEAGEFRAARAQAESGDPAAQHRFGRMFARGLGAPQDYEEAARWYRKAAGRGFGPAQSDLGKLHALGYGVEQRPGEAVRWFRRAAAQNVAEGQFNLGMALSTGHGVRRNHAEAMGWFKKAAHQGHAAAQNQLGVMYRRGHGAAADPCEAYKWFDVAARDGRSIAATANMRELRGTMTADQIAEGDFRAAMAAAQIATTATIR